MSLVINDLRDSLQRAPFVLHMALSDTRARYKRSVLGPLWLTIGAAIGVVGLGLVWSTLLNQSRSELIPSLTIGLILWQFMSACITESPSVFVRQAHVIRNIRLPFFIHPFQLLTRQLIGLAHNLIVLIVVLFIYPPPISTVTLLSIVGLILVVINLLWITTLLGMLGARFRDIEQIVQAFMPIVFFLTPVIYKTGHAGVNQSILWLNPFTYFMSVVRDPLFGQAPPMFVYIVVALMVVCGWTFTIWFFNRRASRIAFWI
jgi:ABC-type polysaccharide/polyol phosphate export permease